MEAVEQPKPNPSKVEKEAQQTIGPDKRAAVWKSDKGNAVVILDKRDYHDKFLTILRDGLFRSF